jgi:hypothetical protein
LRAYYRNSLAAFLAASPSEVAFTLVDQNGRFGFSELKADAVDAWKDEVAVLQDQFSELSVRLPAALQWGVLLEFTIPRRQRRIDAVLLAGELILVLEFKSNLSSSGASPGLRQVEDYALDLASFHQPSHKRVIVPILVAPELQIELPRSVEGNVRTVGTSSPMEVAKLVLATVQAEPSTSERQLSFEEWDDGAYQPVPTVIEAAISLYEGMSVREITRSHAGEENLGKVTDFLLNAIRGSQHTGQKTICFVTGIPGAGKTLAGLNLVHNKAVGEEDRPAPVFLSGNGPLIKVLQEALARDFAKRTSSSITKARNEVRTFVQNVHTFVKTHLHEAKDKVCEKAIVFDEAQRAWSAEKNRKEHQDKGEDWHISEPEMILKIMDRHPDWATIVALVGAGQEIHDGEAGLSEWGRALARYPHWQVMVSPVALNGGDGIEGAVLFSDAFPTNKVVEEDALHLNVSIRSHQAAKLAQWVNCVINGNEKDATSLSKSIEQFPIVLCRDVSHARRWLLTHTRGERRCGLVATSGASRLRAHGLETAISFRKSYSYARWFLDSQEDVRSSYQLEVLATEFEIQGLELDVIGLCWGGDFVWDQFASKWRTLQFTGKRWKDLKGHKAVQTVNKYRVLMTRAREGMVIFVPNGDPNDTTQDVKGMNDTAEYLIRCGASRLE